MSNVVPREGIVNELREGDGKDYLGWVVKVCIGKSAQEIAGLVDGGKSHPDAGKGKGLSLIPLTLLAAVYLNSAQADVVLCVQHDATTGCHRGAIRDDRGEETGRGHWGNGPLTMCDIFIVDIDMVC